MRIDLGINVNATWIGLIAYSESDSGSNWKTFSVTDLSINPTIVQPATTPSTQYNPMMDQNEYRVIIKSTQTNNIVLDFKLSAITNQAGWTNNLTGLIQAHTDIAGWLGSTISASVSVTSVPTPTPTSAASSAATSHRTFGLTETPVAIKASAGNLYGYTIINTLPYPVYVKFCNLAAASVVVGTTPVVKTVMVPANGQVYQDPSSVQIRFGTAMSVYAVRGYLDSSAVVVSANRIIFEAQYE